MMTALLILYVICVIVVISALIYDYKQTKLFNKKLDDLQTSLDEFTLDLQKSLENIYNRLCDIEKKLK